MTRQLISIKEKPKKVTSLGRISFRFVCRSCGLSHINEIEAVACCYKEQIERIKKHPSHKTRFSDASSYDEICTVCGATDSLGSWGNLAKPCPSITSNSTETLSESTLVIDENKIEYTARILAYASGISDWKHLCDDDETDPTMPNWFASRPYWRTLAAVTLGASLKNVSWASPELYERFRPIVEYSISCCRIDGFVDLSQQRED